MRDLRYCPFTVSQYVSSGIQMEIPASHIVSFGSMFLASSSVHSTSDKPEYGASYYVEARIDFCYPVFHICVEVRQHKGGRMPIDSIPSFQHLLL